MNRTQIDSLRRQAHFCIDASDRAEASAALSAHYAQISHERNSWRIAASEAIREGRAIMVRATREVYRPWDGRMGALSA